MRFGQVQSNITLRINLLSIAHSLVWRPNNMVADFSEGSIVFWFYVFIVCGFVHLLF